MEGVTIEKASLTLGSTEVHQRRTSKFDASNNSHHRKDSLDRAAGTFDEGTNADARRRGTSGGLLGGGGGGIGKGTATSSLASRLFRLSRSRRTIAVAFILTIIYLMSSSKHSTALLDNAPVPRAFLPMIERSGKMIHRISPAAAMKVKEWHDLRQARLPKSARKKQKVREGSTSKHTFHKNGLLVVNEKGRHPITILIEAAEKRWKDKLARQSTTLSEAVAEYKSRYRRNPPKGFDLWWEFVQKHNVQLPDEYDQIHHDLQPHRALEPQDSRHRNRVMQDREHTFTIALHPKALQPDLYGPHARLKRASDLASLYTMFGSTIPEPINMTFVIDDNPAVMLPYSQKDRMNELADLGEYYGPSEFIAHDDTELSNFARACAINSPLRRSERGERTEDFSSTTRSFIWDHTSSADICQHPESRKLHGHTMDQGVPLGPLVPLFTFAKTKLHSDILVTPMEQWVNHYDEYEPPWDQKSKNKLFWRGTTTGVMFDKHTPWRLSQRSRLHMLKQETDGEQNILWSQRGILKETSLPTSTLNDLYLDVSFAGQPEQCDPETCELMTNTINFLPTVGLAESNTYKYLMDVDGNGWSGRFHRLMSTKSLVFKSTIFPEWYADRIEPWYHYIPVKIDYSDIYDSMAYFVGLPDGQGGHDSTAQRLGENGRVWAETFWRKADMAAYMYRLTLEYSRILSMGVTDDVDYIDLNAFDLP